MCEHRLPGIDQIDAAARIVYRSMPATPQYRWPLLEERAGCTVWVKHENHAPIDSMSGVGRSTGEVDMRLTLASWQNE